MKPVVTTLTILAASLALARGAPEHERPEMHVEHAVEVEFHTETNKIYRLQRSTNLVDWENVGDDVYGSGRRQRHLFSTKREDGVQREHAYYRVASMVSTNDGLAPWSLAGITLNLDDQPGGDLVQFLTETNGVDLGVAPDDFHYVFTRLGLNEVRAEIIYGALYYGVPTSNKIDILTLTFTAPGLGTWVRDEMRFGRMKDRDVGVFTVVGGTTPGGTNNPPGNPGGTNNPPVVPIEIPSALTGLAYLFQSGATPDRLEFSTATTGTEFGDDVNDDEPNVFTYTYSLTSSNRGALVVTFKPGKWDEYDLSFLNGAQGSFVRREFDNSLLKDTDTGAFSAVGLPHSITNQPPGGTNAPPTNPVGLTYHILSGAIPEHLQFQTATTGTQLDDSAPTQFTYTYQTPTPMIASVVVTFKPDKWDEYDLTFTSGTGGTFFRREFDKNVLKDTDDGPFTVSPTQP